jgi:hypothetical protein
LHALNVLLGCGFSFLFIVIVLSPRIPNPIPSYPFFWSILIVLAGFGAACGWYQQELTKRERKPPQDLTKREVGGSLIVLSGIYAIVAGFAITAALGNYADALTMGKSPIKTPLDLLFFLCSDQNYFHNTVLLFGFFLVASTSYLGATFFLSYDVGSAPLQTERVRFFTFIISFLQAAFLFLMSRKEAMSSIDIFVIWLFLLYFFNFVWSILYLVTSVALGLESNVPAAPRQWIPLNGLTMAFLLLYVLYPHLVNSDWSTYTSLLIVLFGSTMSDYYIAWGSVYSRVIKLT